MTHIDEPVALATRPGRSRGRKRIIGALIALALAAGPIIGFEFGQRLGDRDRIATASDGDRQHESPGPSTRSPESRPLATPSMGGGGTDDWTAGQGSTYGFGYDLQRVGVVDVGDTTIRLFRSDFGPPDTGNPQWDPPVGCFPTGSVMAQASTPEMVAVVAGETYGLKPTEGVVNVVGVAEGDPHWLVVGSTPASAMTVLFPDGQRVAATVVGGLFAAAAPADGFDGMTEPEASVTADGQETAIGTWAGPVDEDFYRQCEPPPPALPPAGQQPDDPDSARTQIAEAFRVGYRPGEQQADAFEDPEAIRPVLDELATSESFDQYRGKIEAIVGEVVFDTPTHAWLFYDLEPILSRRMGEAVLTDRGWKVANVTICADVAMTGVRCG